VLQNHHGRGNVGPALKSVGALFWLNGLCELLV